MKEFKSYFTEKEILRQICKIRVKLAKSRSKKHLLHLLTSNDQYNYHLDSSKEASNKFEQYQLELTQFLVTILPPRKKWVKLGSVSRRKPGKENEFLTSNDKNFYSLLKTIKSHSKKELKEQWFINLQKFISEILELSNDDSYIIAEPIIIPKLKDKLKDKLKKDEKNECRPICIFTLKDRIILSVTNKFLTRLFDCYFQESSYAFRSKKNDSGMILSHHDCVEEILKFRKENINKDLFVAECDMKKFYDTVNHKITRRLFDELILKSKLAYPELNLEMPIKIFDSYLNRYSFNVDVPESSDTEYWLSYKIPSGEFSWIESIISTHYSDITAERIGVPQGGALSGLIANIYLNQADTALINKKLLYMRFCDDMIIIADNMDECNEAKSLYEKTLNDLKLFPHPFKNEKDLMTIKDNEINYKLFWGGKSKGPYKWGKIEKNSFPWIGFVGYEINYFGDIRVRKKSLEKELQKQKAVINKIKNAIKVEMRKDKGTATESAISRLIGMSVGRIGLDNFEEVSTDMCWKNGFKQLNVNEHSIRQIKQLDRNRNKQYYKLLKEIEKHEPELEPTEQDSKKSKNGNKRNVIKYNKPFSYYYQILERQKKTE